MEYLTKGARLAQYAGFLLSFVRGSSSSFCSCWCLGVWMNDVANCVAHSYYYYPCHSTTICIQHELQLYSLVSTPKWRTWLLFLSIFPFRRCILHVSFRHESNIYTRIYLIMPQYVLYRGTIVYRTWRYIEKTRYFPNLNTNIWTWRYVQKTIYFPNLNTNIWTWWYI